MSEEDVYVQVLHDFTYESERGKKVIIKKGEELLVVQKSNFNWWQVIRDSENEPFYAPSSYLDIIYNPLNNGIGNSPDENANVQENQGINHDVKDVHFEKIHDCRDQLSIKTDIKSTKNQNDYKAEYADTPCTVAIEKPGYTSTLQNLNNSICDDELEKNDPADEKKSHSLSLSQDNLPIYANIPLSTSISPPNPKPYETPHRSLPNNWFEFIDDNGRKYYYHSLSSKVTWKPPRRSESLNNSFDESVDKNLNLHCPAVPKPPPKQLKPKLKKLTHSSTESLDSTSSPCMFTILPPGWTQECDIQRGTVYYSNKASKKRWYSSQDENGRTYFYDEDSSESFWELPDIIVSDVENQDSFENSPDVSSHSVGLSKKQEYHSFSAASPKLRSKKVPKLPVSRQFKVRSMVVSESIHIPSIDDEKNSSCSLGCTIYSGILNKTKLVEHGQRVRKNWASCYVVLTDALLLFYKDARSVGQSPNLKPEFSIDLNGALVDWCPDKSSRKNVFQISTITGHQLLLQHDDSKEMKDWFSAIKEAIIKLPSSLENFGGKSTDRENSQDVKLSRSKSTKYCHCRKGSTEDVSETTQGDKKRKIRDKLRHFFVRRPTMESLREKGIILDEPVFGCHLDSLCQRDGQYIPKFVTKCIQTIEKKELTADGIYRASGNLSQVQKIRFHVNQDDYRCLDDEDDVHVLTGALKMFFREMKEPLFPFKFFNSFLAAIGLSASQSKLHALKELVYSIPKSNFETLKYLLQHLLRVTVFHKQNRMQIQNLAIVFGPTLMWPEEESANIALDMMHQNRIVEFLLLEYYTIFD